LLTLGDIPASQLPQSVLKGDNYTIAIPEEEVDTGINSCKFCCKIRHKIISVNNNQYINKRINKI